jgi:hypothetical protein
LHLSGPALDLQLHALDAAHAALGRAHRDLMWVIATLGDDIDWAEYGARDAAHFIAMRYDVSEWKARRWVAAAEALTRLPALRAALASGHLGLDKAVELTRFAATEARLIAWASGRSAAAVRRLADREVRVVAAETREAQAQRFVAWYPVDDGRQLAITAQLPSADGAMVIRAISRLAERVPTMPQDEGPWSIEHRRADALVALCSAAIAADPDPDRATLVVHTTFDDLRTGGNGETEGGDVVIPGVALQRMLCNARVQVVAEDAAGAPVGIGRVSRVVPVRLARLVRHRDGGCRFPGCGARAFTEAHHIVWWRHGGPTDLDNLVLLCSFHHRLVHEHGWSLHASPGGALVWLDPRGTTFASEQLGAVSSGVDRRARSPGTRPAA